MTDAYLELLSPLAFYIGLFDLRLPVGGPAGIPPLRRAPVVFTGPFLAESLLAVAFGPGITLPL